MNTQFNTKKLTEELKKYFNSFDFGSLQHSEVINNIISQGQGLLLSVEDSKSAVNIELSKASHNIENNITVQTVIIPQKEKLLSILAEDKNSQPFFRFKNDKAVQLSMSAKAENRPSISLYVFDNGNQDLNNFRNATKIDRNTTSRSVQRLSGEFSLDQSNSVPQTGKNLSPDAINNNSDDPESIS